MDRKHKQPQTPEGLDSRLILTTKNVCRARNEYTQRRIGVSVLIGHEADSQDNPGRRSSDSRSGIAFGVRQRDFHANLNEQDRRARTFAA